MSENKIRCDICNYNDSNEAIYGKMISKLGWNVHYYCLLSGYNIPQNGKDNQGIYGFLVKDLVTAKQEFQDNTCYFCGKKNAAVKCCHEAGCDRYWHFPCGRTYDCLTQFIGAFKSYCNLHAPDTNAIKHNGTWCSVCYKLVLEYSPVSSIFSQCCFDAAHAGEENFENPFERFVCNFCVQNYAYNAGYDAMCITCGMKSMKKAEWQDQMRLKGIYVPMEMATWEKEPHYKALVKNKCSDSKCPYPFNTKNVWTCRVCGCDPRHLSCARVTTVDDYLCSKCFDQSFVQRVPLL